VNCGHTNEAPLKPRKHFLGLLCDCLNRNHNSDDHIFISFVCPQFTQYSYIWFLQGRLCD